MHLSYLVILVENMSDPRIPPQTPLSNPHAVDAIAKRLGLSTATRHPHRLRTPSRNIRQHDLPRHPSPTPTRSNDDDALLQGYVAEEEGEDFDRVGNIEDATSVASYASSRASRRSLASRSSHGSRRGPSSASSAYSDAPPASYRFAPPDLSKTPRFGDAPVDMCIHALEHALHGIPEAARVSIAAQHSTEAMKAAVASVANGAHGWNDFATLMRDWFEPLQPIEADVDLSGLHRLADEDWAPFLERATRFALAKHPSLMRDQQRLCKELCVLLPSALRRDAIAYMASHRHFTRKDFMEWAVNAILLDRDVSKRIDKSTKATALNEAPKIKQWAKKPHGDPLTKKPDSHLRKKAVAAVTADAITDTSGKEKGC